MAGGAVRKPRGVEVIARKRQEYNRAVAPRIIALLESGLSQQETADRLNAERHFNSDGRPWTQVRINYFVHHYVSSEDRAAIAGIAEARMADPYRAVLVPQLHAWWREGRSHAAVAELANADERFRGTGPWNQARVRRALLRHLDPSEYADLAAESMARGPAARLRALEARDERVGRLAVELRQSGLTYGAIAAHFHEQNITTPAGRFYDTSAIRKLIVRRGGPTGRVRRTEKGPRPVILGRPGKSVQVLGPGGIYREKPPLGKAQRLVVRVLIEAGPGGLHTYQLQALTGDARGVIRRLARDPDWSAVIAPPEGELGWRIRSPQAINYTRQ